ncbi:hypothetical protein GCM10010965_23450 [Caldalkalibacillus thermarum]|nr:hypothetical protein GCM10010965_23450 [Caldalkalibacillus thermarum]
MFIGQFLTDAVLVKVEQLHQVAQELDLSLSTLALAWVLRQDNVASALVGASRPEQIEANVQASGVKLEEDVLAQIEQILDGESV